MEAEGQIARLQHVAVLLLMMMGVMSRRGGEGGELLADAGRGGG